MSGILTPRIVKSKKIPKHSILENERLSDFLYSAFRCLKLTESQFGFIKNIDLFSIKSLHDFRDSYRNSVLHYLISSPFTVATKEHILRTYFTPPDLLCTNEDGISILDLSVIQCESELVIYILSVCGSVVRKDQLLRAYKLLLLFDHFSQPGFYTHLYKILSHYYSRYQSDLSLLTEKINSLSSDADALATAAYLLLDGDKCSQVACALGVSVLKTKNKRDFIHSCILVFLDKNIPTITQCMYDYIHGSQCIKSVFIMNDAFLTGRGPRSPIRSQLPFYCDWYLTTLHVLLYRDLFAKSELLVLKSLFIFVHTLSLWFSYYSKSHSEDIVSVRASLLEFVEKTSNIPISPPDTRIPFKRYFTLINIFCILRHCLDRIDIDTDMEFIQFLIECGFSINERDVFGLFPLHIILKNKTHQKVKPIQVLIEYLVENGCYPLSVECYSGQNAIALACEINRDTLHTCYPKPYPLKSLAAQSIVLKGIIIPPNCLPFDLYKFVLRHSTEVPFLKLIGFRTNSVRFEFKYVSTEISICSEISNLF